MFSSSYLPRVAVTALVVASGQAAVAETRQADVVTVVASKQDISLAETDAAVLVKTGEELARAGVTEVKDLQKVFPGLLIQSRGNRTYTSTTVRGISSPDFYSPTVTVLVDGVRQDSAFVTQQLINVDRVEFLRGPQGTLYGGNAQGGIINIVTRKGNDQPQATAGVTYSNLTRQLDGAASFALSDDVYTDFALRSQQTEGRIDHRPATGTGEKDADGSENYSGLIRLHYLPEDSPWDASLSLGFDHLNSNEEWYLSAQEFKNKATTQAVPKLDREVESYTLNINHEMGNRKFSSITSFQNRSVDRLYVGGQWHEDQKTVSQELRLQTEHSQKLSTVFGAYFENRRFEGEAFGATNTVDVDTVAIFGQGRYALTEAVDLTVGLRGSRIESDSDYSGNAGFGIAAYDSSVTDNLVTPKVALGWQVNEDSRVYVSVASGYRPKGFNRVPFGNNSTGYDTEKSLSTELGWRTSLFDHSLDFSGALYQIDTDDIQLYTGNIPNQVLDNFGEARSRGVELDLAWYATDNLTLNLGGTFGKSEFRDGNGALNGNRLAYAPDTTVVLGVDYLLPVSVAGGGLSLLANARHNSTVYFNETNTLSQSALTLVDMAAELEYDRFTYRFYVNNVADKDYTTYAFQQGATVLSNYGEGREFGVTFRAEF
ncbi:TonB-dependent receptor [Aliamphritea hakodatensis]|uniref:TonB-dependent receptor n=1 Tax=Aliamphritea hakodatensis TaxID=2895352 RepID=UPI0022FD80F2|nr:TonB-dependent receptor [Aliamphritea hakodatensis]